MTKEKFSDLILECEQTMYRVSMSMLRNESDCEDAVQTTILAAYERLYTLRREEYFKTWLIRILINVCNKQLKFRSRHTELNDEHEAKSTDTSSDVRYAIEKLPEKIRQAVVLYYIEGFSVGEVKQIMKIPEGTVKSRLAKGRELLREELKER